MSLTRPKPDPMIKTNQLHRELLSVSGFDSFAAHGTSPRKQMFATHLGQCLVVKHSTERSYQTGMERAYAKYTFSIKAPTTMHIIAIVNRYPEIQGVDKIKFNPQSIVVYEDLITRTISAMDVRRFKANHPHFGFDYVARPASQLLRAGETIEKDTIFYDSPSVTENGGYKYGVELNILHATLPATSEDGSMISESAAKKFTYMTFETRVADCGADEIPIFLYGTDEQPKICPDIGEKVRDDGLLFVTRKVDDNLAPFYQSKHALRKYFPKFDTPIYVPPGGTVIDIQVHHDPLCKQARVPTGMDDQLLKYQRSLMNFHKAIKDIWSKYLRERGEGLKLSPEFERLVVDAIAYTDDKANARPQRQYRLARLGDWRIEFTVRYENVPSVGNKATGCFGDSHIEPVNYI